MVGKRYTSYETDMKYKIRVYNWYGDLYNHFLRTFKEAKLVKEMSYKGDGSFDRIKDVIEIEVDSFDTIMNQWNGKLQIWPVKNNNEGITHCLFLTTRGFSQY